jgi:hypothetical protein
MRARRNLSVRDEDAADGQENAQDPLPPASAPPVPQLNFRNLDSYKFEHMTKFERADFLKFARKHRHTVSRCKRDHVSPTPLRELFSPDIIGRVMKAAGLSREDRDELGEAWLELSDDDILSALNAHFLGSCSQQEQQTLYEAIPFPRFSDFPTLQVSYETYCAEWTRLGTDLRRASEALGEDGANPLAASTRSKVMLSTLSMCPVLLHIFKGKKFEDEDAILDLVDPYLDGIVEFQRQHRGMPGVTWPTLSCPFDSPAAAPGGSAKRAASVNSLVSTEAPPAPASAEQTLTSAVNALVAKLSAEAPKPSVSIPVCSHCGGRHDIKACWYKHVKKPKGGGVAMVTSEERQRTRVARGLSAIATRTGSRTGSPHPRPRAADPPSDDDVNSDTYLSPPCALLAARAGVGAQGLRNRALRRRQARCARATSFQVFCAELEAAGVLPQPSGPQAPPSKASARRSRRASRSPEDVQAAAAAGRSAKLNAINAGAAIQVETALSVLRLSAGATFTDAVALLDTGTSHNFVRPALAEVLIASGARSRDVPRLIKAGGAAVGNSSREVQLRVTREKDGVQEVSLEWALTFDAGFDFIVGLPALLRWGWVSFDGVRRPAAQSNAITTERLVSREISCSRLSRQACEANIAWAALPSVTSTPRALALATEKRLGAVAAELRGHQLAAKGLAAVDWRLRTPPAVGCLRGSRALDIRLLPSPVDADTCSATASADNGHQQPQLDQPPSASTKEKAKHACHVRFLILGPPLSEQRAESAAARRARKLMRAGATVIPVGSRLFRVVAARQEISRRAGTRQQCTLFSLDAQRSNFQLKEDAARIAGDDVRADFFRRLDALCRRWGYFDAKRIFSPDLTTPSKMSPMRIKLMGGARRMPMRLAMRRHSQPQKDEVRKQLITMLKQLVAERAGPDAWMSCVHLVRKPDATPTATDGTSNAVVNALAALGAAAGDAGLRVVLPCKARTKASGGDCDASASEIQSLTTQPVTVTEVELDTHFLQGWSDACGSGGAAAMTVASLFSMEADIQIGPSLIRWRFTIDFRKLNDVTVEEFYPFPETRECIESLAGDELFGSLDLSSMYWQIEVHPEDRHLTGFATEDGCFIFRRVPFGLKNACAHAQKEFRAVLRSDARLDSVNNYLDDCFWGTRGSDKYEAFLRITQALFEVCEKFNVKINAAKTFLGEESLRVLGHHVDKHGMHIDPARRASLVGLETPTGKTGLQQVKAALGAMQYVRSFIPSFSSVAAPLTGMSTFVWGKEQAHAWSELKRLIQTSGVLCNPNYSIPFYLKADASKRGLGGCLYQWGSREDGTLERRVIAYCSKKFCKREQDWKTIEQECFSVVYSLQKFRPLIQGCAVTVLNDHRNLVWLRSNESSSKCVRWSMVLDEYSITWRHLPGKATKAQEEDATVPDGLSRSFGPSIPAAESGRMTDREERLLADLDVQLSALSVEANADGVTWDARTPLEEQMAVLVLCMQACERAEPGFIHALSTRDARIMERDKVKRASATAKQQVQATATAKQQQRATAKAKACAQTAAAAASPVAASRNAETPPVERLPAAPREAPLPPTTAAELAVASRTMLAAARRLANAGRLMAHEDATWRHNRATAAPDSYGGQIQQRDRWQGNEVAGRLPEDTGPLQRWSELGEVAKRAAFEQAHCFPASHAGAIPTRDRIIKRGNFSLAKGELERILEDVRGFKASCPTCQLLRKWDQEDETLSAIPARPWVDVSVDFLMVSPTDHLGHIAILIVEDNFSGACELLPVKSITAETLARECVKVFARTNAPITIRSDQGPAFESLVNNALMRAMGVVQHRVLHGHHRANGIVERTNSDVVRMLRACVLDDRVVPSALVSWAELTPWIQRNINRAISSKTRKAPVQLLYGDRVDLDRELFDPVPDNFYNGPPVKIGGYVQALIDSYDGCLRAALDYQASRLARVAATRRLVPETQFVPGEWVLVRLPVDQVHDKMEPRWEGPFRVLARTGDHSYTVLDTVRAAERRIRDVHVTSLCRFDWAWMDIPADDEAARAAYAAKLAVRAAARPMGTPHTIIAVRQCKTTRVLPLHEGRGTIPLSKLEFQCSFAELGVQDAWVPFIRLEGGDLLTSFLLEHRNWR